MDGMRCHHGVAGRPTVLLISGCCRQPYFLLLTIELGLQVAARLMVALYVALLYYAVALLVTHCSNAVIWTHTYVPAVCVGDGAPLLVAASCQQQGSCLKQ